jgi:hypothetical protein
MHKSIIPPKAPKDKTGWRRFAVQLPGCPDAQGWEHFKNGLRVISDINVAEGILTNDVLPQYHLSISKVGRGGMVERCLLAEAMWVLHQFGLDDALEDNHTSIARSFWRPLADNLAGIECQCKGTEAAITEGDFTWRPLKQDNYDRSKRLAEGGAV